VILRRAVSTLLLVATALGLYNVYADNPEVVKLAATTACGAAGCVRTLRTHRTPMGHDFEFQVSVEPQRAVEVHCARAYLLLGRFECESVKPAR
jgi:hypothetical protein